MNASDRHPEGNQIRPLTALLNLLITLAFSIPDFSSSLLSRSQDGDIDQPSIITLWCDIIQDQLVPRKLSEEVDQDLMALGRETVGLIEALCWNIPDEFIEKCATIYRTLAVKPSIKLFEQAGIDIA
jgi:hypothetical protein